eukprot:7869646-Lingulodinium_polyedra.AAC.1
MLSNVPLKGASSPNGILSIFESGQRLDVNACCFTHLAPAPRSKVCPGRAKDASVSGTVNEL